MQKTILVTGANRGIGKAIAKILEGRDCTVVKAARKPFGGINEGWLELDITDDASVERAAIQFSEKYKSLDVLINNAAILLDRSADFMAQPLHELQETLEVNVTSTQRVTLAFLPFLKKSSEARIINMSSRAGALNSPSAFAPSYCVSKTALNGLTVQQAISLRSHGISVNCMSPGWVNTDMGGPGAPLTPEQGADTAVWLALEASHHETGKFWADRREIEW